MKYFHLIGIALLLSGCVTIPTPEPTATVAAPYVLVTEDNPYAPKPEDANKQIAGVTMTSINLLERFDLDPVRVEVDFLGSLPSVCNILRVKVNPPDDKHQVFIDVYSLIDPNVQCDNVFQQFNASILLGVYSTGRFTVWVNGGLIGDFVTY